MKHLEIPNVPDELYEQIEQQARGRGHSVEEETIAILAEMLSSRRQDELIVAEARKNREELIAQGLFLTDDDLHEAIEWGRE